MDVIDELIAYCEAWEPWARVMGNVCAGDAAQALRSLRADLTMAGAFHKAAVAQRNSAWEEIEHLRAELAEAKRDVDRINWMEKNKVGIYAAQSSVRATTGPRYFKPWKFCGWSAANRDDELPTVREAIDAAMAGGGHG